MPRLFCLSCGYNLEGTPSGKCPECGRAFDHGLLADHIKSRLITFDDAAKRLIISSILPGFLFWPFVCAGFFSGVFFWHNSALLIGAIVILLVVGAILIRRCAPPAIEIAHGIAMHLAFHARESGSISNNRVFVLTCAALILAAQFATIFTVNMAIFRGGCALIELAILIYH